MRDLRRRSGQLGGVGWWLSLTGKIVGIAIALPAVVPLLSSAQTPPLPLTETPFRPPATELPEVSTELSLTLNQVSFDASDLTDRVQGMVKAAVPYDIEAPPYLNGAPTHLQFTFRNAVTDLFPDSYPSVGRLYVYPVGGWRGLYAGYRQEMRDVNLLLGRLRSLLTLRPLYIADEVAILPNLSATQVLRSQVSYLNFQSGSGVRFLTTYSQELSPIARSNLFYTFQGMSSDGKYYISFYHPILTAVLPETVADLITADNYDAFVAEYENYLRRITQQINVQDAASFAPTLTQLDTMVRSLRITPAPSPAPTSAPDPSLVPAL